MSGKGGSALGSYDDIGAIHGFVITEAQRDRLATHIRDHVSDPAERLDAAEALGLVGYIGHDTAGPTTRKTGTPVQRVPIPCVAEEDLDREATAAQPGAASRC